MASSIITKVNVLRCKPGFLPLLQSVRTINKHWDPKFKKLRGQKYIKVKFPDYNEDSRDMSPEKIRQKMKQRGLLPPRPWMERPFHISCTGGVFEAYVPPEGDGRASLVSTARAKQAVQLLEKKSKTMMAIRKVKSYDDEFDTKTFANQAYDIYVKAHEHLAANDKHGLRQFVTEKAYPELRHNTYQKTLTWKLISSLEAPRVVHARCTDVISKENIYSQITVRLHTQQQLAIYDRFGRLMHGSEIIAKDVLEYIVFEKHISDMYGVWRLHHKIIPEWTPPREPMRHTFQQSLEAIDVGLSKTAIADEEKKKVEQIASS